MRILFCRTGYMKFYKGVSEKDPIQFGGSYVEKNKIGHEEYNFREVFLDGNPDAQCLGFVETKSRNEKSYQLHIEKIQGLAALKDAAYAEDVLVVWCAKTEPNSMRVMGWYKHAVVYRNYQPCVIDGEERVYNVIAKSADCLLLPRKERIPWYWRVPYSKKNTYGLGQSEVWYAGEPEAEAYVRELAEKIENYDGDNWIDVYEEDEDRIFI